MPKKALDSDARRGTPAGSASTQEAPPQVEAAPAPDEQPAAQPEPVDAAAPVAIPGETPAPHEAAPAPGELPAEPVDAAAPVAAPGEEPAPDETAPANHEEPGTAATATAEQPAGAAETANPTADTALDHHEAAALTLERKKRRQLLLILGALLALLVASGGIFVRYLLRPGPLPDLLPLPMNVNYRPHYLFSIYDVDLPAGVAVSPDGERIYVTETGGQRQVKILAQDGLLLGTLAPPQTQPADRAPVYVAVDAEGRVFVTDRLQRAVFVYGPDGRLLDAILGPDLTLSEYLSQHLPGARPEDVLAFNRLADGIRVRPAGQSARALPAPDAPGWAPLGVRLDAQGSLLLTTVAEGAHAVLSFPGEQLLAAAWQQLDPPAVRFGSQGQEAGQLLFPNVAVSDSQGRIHVTDGNNGRISVWDASGAFLFTFGRGVGDAALSLPRGAAMDRRDRLHIVDAVQQAVKVYDVSGPEPRFLYAFGDWGTGSGQFNYPADMAFDDTGRLYIADRKNNRIQVWSY